MLTNETAAPDTLRTDTPPPPPPPATTATSTTPPPPPPTATASSRRRLLHLRLRLRLLLPPPPPPPPPAPPPPPPPPSGGGLVCPVQGSSSYADTWGAARSGGRSHEGVDLIASAGTPLVAVVSGQAEMRSSSLGGNSVRILGDNGDYYFYAHLRRTPARAGGCPRVRSSATSA
ncbi:MAG: M23 family metallopeptidase [Ilumatobacteraceae bacterium]